MKKNNQKQHRGLIVATNAIAAATVLCGAKVFANEFIDDAGAASSTTTINAIVHSDNEPYYVNVAADAKINLEIHESDLGKIVSGKNTVTTKTNSPFGYKLSVSMGDDDQRLYRNDDHSGQSGYFEATDGTASNPTTLNDNTWGYAVAKNSVNTNFDEVYALSNPSLASKWAALAPMGKPTLVQETTNASLEGTSLDVYYAAKTTTKTTPGTYSGTIIYTATANTSLEDLRLSTDTGSEGTEVIIATPLVTFAQDLGKISATIGGKDCDSLQSIMESNQLKVVCKVPELAEGNHDVVVEAQRFGRKYTLSGGFKFQK